MAALSTLAVVALVSLACADAQSPLSNCSLQSLPVLGGIDVVEFETLTPDVSVPVFGVADFTSTLKNKAGSWTFQFVNAENLKRFEADPWRYAPAWGGF